MNGSLGLTLFAEHFENLIAAETETSTTVEMACRSANITIFIRCYRQLIDVEKSIPIRWTLPVYGYLMPLLIVLTTLTNGVVLVVLQQRRMRSPTNFVLMAMAVAELATGLSTLPWLLQHYSLGGYETDRQYGMGWFWCRTHAYFAMHLPSLCHTASCWLTVYLAFQRYIYICLPAQVHRHCTIRMARRSLIRILIGDLLYHAPVLLASRSHFTVAHPQNPLYNGLRRLCVNVPTFVVQLVGANVYFNTVWWLQMLCAHIVPCGLLIGFTYRLTVGMRGADARHLLLTVAAVPRFGGTDASADTTDRQLPCPTPLRNPYGAETSPICSQAILLAPLRAANERRSPVQGVPQASILRQQRREASTKQHLRMLAVVISLFLVVELSAAALNLIHVFLVMFRVGGRSIYTPINIMLMLRNVLVLVMYPLRLGIYCSMSAQFRDTARQFFCRVLATSQQHQVHSNSIEPQLQR